MEIILIFQLIILLFSVIIHEVSHGLVALGLGDTTAKDAGRLTLNPLKHLDFFGSFLLPISLYLVSGGSFVFGWAKPVPYNPFNLKDLKRGSGLIAAAGPVSNFLLALLTSLILRVGNYLNLGFNPVFLEIAIIINLSLMIFNLVPIPPLDGSKILFSLLPRKFDYLFKALERYGMMIFILFIFFGFGLITPLISLLFRLLT
jgi:Zn-dependent protease